MEKYKTRRKQCQYPHVILCYLVLHRTHPFPSEPAARKSVLRVVRLLSSATGVARRSPPPFHESPVAVGQWQLFLCWGPGVSQTSNQTNKAKLNASGSPRDELFANCLPNKARCDLTSNNPTSTPPHHAQGCRVRLNGLGAPSWCLGCPAWHPRFLATLPGLWPPALYFQLLQRIRSPPSPLTITGGGEGREREGGREDSSPLVPRKTFGVSSKTSGRSVEAPHPLILLHMSLLGSKQALWNGKRTWHWVVVIQVRDLPSTEFVLQNRTKRPSYLEAH